MTDTKREAPERIYLPTGTYGMDKIEAGEWVRKDLYEAERAKVERLERELDRARAEALEKAAGLYLEWIKDCGDMPVSEFEEKYGGVEDDTFAKFLIRAAKDGGDDDE